MVPGDEQQRIKHVEDEWENLRSLFVEECARINKAPGVRAEVVGRPDNPDDDEAFCIVNARRDRRKPLLQFELNRTVPSIVCTDHWNNLPRQSFKFVFYGASVLLSSGAGGLSVADIARRRMTAIMPGLQF